MLPAFPAERPTLTTARLILRPFTLDDAAAVQRLAGVPEVACVTANIPHPYEDGMAEGWIGSHPQLRKDGALLALAITKRENGTLMGCVSLGIQPAHEKAELGYWLGTPFWGEGIMTEAARALVDYGFDELGLNRVQSRHLTRNPASGRVMQKLGMLPEGIQREVHLNRYVPRLR